MDILNEISQSLQMGKSKDVDSLVNSALEQGIAPEEILNNGLLAGMDVIGEKFKNNEIYVPQVLLAARAMNTGTAILKPLLQDESNEAKGTVILGTVKGDLHDIGKNLVRMMMEGKGLTVIDLGTDVSAQSYVDAAIENNAKVIACSALLTTTMGEMDNVVKLLKEKGLDDKIKVIVGGAPVTKDFADSIGAYYTNDAASAAEMALKTATA